jgi:hypothetical protein
MMEKFITAAFVLFVNAWIDMAILGSLHHRHPGIPNLGYFTTVLLTWVLASPVTYAIVVSKET